MSSNSDKSCNNTGSILQEIDFIWGRRLETLSFSPNELCHCTSNENTYA